MQQIHELSPSSPNRLVAKPLCDLGAFFLAALIVLGISALLGAAAPASVVLLSYFAMRLCAASRAYCVGGSAFLTALLLLLLALLSDILLVLIADFSVTGSLQTMHWVCFLFLLPVAFTAPSHTALSVLLLSGIMTYCTLRYSAADSTLVALWLGSGAALLYCVPFVQHSLLHLSDILRGSGRRTDKNITI